MSLAKFMAELQPSGDLSRSLRTSDHPATISAIPRFRPRPPPHTMNTRFEERLTSIPEIPKEFGEDGGHFYRYYDALADEIDDDMVKSLKAQLDGILI